MMNGGDSLRDGTAIAEGERRLRWWRGLALALAAALAALAFAAYTQPDLLLNYTGLRYCG